MIDYSELLDAGRVKAGRFSHDQVVARLGLARRDLDTAQRIAEVSPDWAFNIAYNAMHQAGRAFLLHRGYRTVGEAHHVTVVRFLELSLGLEHQETLAVMDRMRRKRNRATYDIAGTISQKEVQEAIGAAREFVAEIAKQLDRGRR